MIYQEMTPAEQRAADLAEQQRMRSLIEAIVENCKTVPPTTNSGTAEGRAVLEAFIEGLTKAAQQPNALTKESETK